MEQFRIAVVNSSSFAVHFPDHLERLKRIGSVERLSFPADVDSDTLASALKDFDAVIASVTPRFSGEALARLPRLRVLSRHGIGCDNVDSEAAAAAGIIVSRVPGIVEREAVAEHAVALLMAAARFIAKGADLVRSGSWSERAGLLGMELRGRKVGIIGLGNIGSRASEILSFGFKSEVLAYDPYAPKDRFTESGAKSASLDEITQQCEVISLHCPLTAETKRSFNRARLERTRKGVIIVNTTRGEMFDEEALVEGLKSGHIGAYATDVVEGEPISSDHRLLACPNAIVVPHLGGYTTESLRGMGDSVVSDVEDVLVHGKEPQCVVNPAVLKNGKFKWSISSR